MHASMPGMDKVGINAKKFGDKVIMLFDLFDGFCRAGKLFNPPVLDLGKGSAIQGRMVRGVYLAPRCREISAKCHLAREGCGANGLRNTQRKSFDGQIPSFFPHGLRCVAR